ncbi:recombinase family protein [Micromonospora sp. 4G57]|uniref:Recombinase family protein n=2 Tax=Micromonospora TaxID=1873 RepID=A0ABU5JG60_9ACTN|nr:MULTISPECIES: recombinase family protein [unclassified Micromonospora]MDZ5445510.1 recombinase family protein [Micromonospora sp. 4G57]MDZ5491558.1 recombinase family protein [Micromonospora sp. 4G53]
MSHHEHLADLYLRLSLDREGKTAIERQEADCRAWCARNGLDVRTVHIDRGRSGYKAVDRAGFDAAISALTTGTVGTLVVWKVDRLSRRGMGQVGQVLDQVEKVAGRIVFVQDGLDTSRQQARLALVLLSEVARSESANIGLRVASAKAHLRSLGRWIGGQPPYGLAVGEDGRLDHDPHTAPTAREIAERALSGEPLVHIARDLNARKIPATRGGAWGVGSLSVLLKSPAFAGLLPETVKKDGKYTGKVVPWRDPETGKTVDIGRGIITPAEQLQVMRILEARTGTDPVGRNRGVRAQVSHLLTGFLRCGGCGRRMSAAGRSYVCQGRRLGHPCPAHVTAFIAAVDRAVVDAFINRLAATEPGDPLLDAVAERWIARHDPDIIRERATITAALEDANASLVDLEDARYLRGEFVGPEAVQRWTRLHERLTARVVGLRRNLADFPLPEADISPLLDPVQAREAWDAATVPDRRDLLRLALNAVTITPAHGRRGVRFDPDARLRFTWADEPESASPDA